MKQQMVFTATEARQNFFEILNLLEKGNDAIIVKKDSKERFLFTKLPKKETKKGEDLADALSKIGMKTMSPQEIKEIIKDTHKIDL